MRRVLVTSTFTPASRDVLRVHQLPIVFITSHYGAPNIEHALVTPLSVELAGTLREQVDYKMDTYD